MSLRLPTDSQPESEEQKKAREIVEACLQKSFGFKLAHGIILTAFKFTLGSLWRANEGSDDVPGTYAHLLRYGIADWNQNVIPSSVEFSKLLLFKRGPLLRED